MLPILESIISILEYIQLFGFTLPQFRPAWHPSGDYIVYNKQTSTSSNLHILSLFDGETKRLTTHQMGVDAHPTWSADGKYIAFHSDRAGNFDIWIMEIPLTI